MYQYVFSGTCILTLSPLFFMLQNEIRKRKLIYTDQVLTMTAMMIVSVFF